MSRHIVAAEIIVYKDLGIEVVRKLQVIDFPAVVAYNCYGNIVYQEGVK